MAAEIELITFAERNVTPTDDAVMWEVAIAESGVIYGCQVTLQSANMLHVSAGHGVLCGRKFTMFESNVSVTLSPSGSLLGRIYAHMDLSNTAQPISLQIETGESLTPEVHDENVNIVNGVWDMNLATFDVNELTISNVKNVFPSVSGSNLIAAYETGTTASQAFAKGAYIIWRGKMYEVIAAIAQGDSFVVGTNLSASDTTVGNELTKINNSLTELLRVEAMQISSAISVPANDYYDGSIPWKSVTGYKPLCISGFNAGTKTYFAYVLSSASSLIFRITNPTASAITTQPEFQIVYIKDV